MKYHSKKVKYDDFTFASKLEAAVYHLLKLREKNGEIFNIKCQETVYLSDARIIFKPDFSYEDGAGVKHYAEAKGIETASYRIKRKLWMSYGKHELEVYKGHHLRPFLAETIKPCT